MSAPPLTPEECAVLREHAGDIALADSIAQSGLGLLLGRLLDEHRARTAALVQLVWRSVADDAACSCYPGDACPECEAMQALGLGRWSGAEAAAKLLTQNYGAP